MIITRRVLSFNTVATCICGKRAIALHQNQLTQLLLKNTHTHTCQTLNQFCLLLLGRGLYEYDVLVRLVGNELVLSNSFPASLAPRSQDRARSQHHPFHSLPLHPGRAEMPRRRTARRRRRRSARASSASARRRGLLGRAHQLLPRRPVALQQGQPGGRLHGMARPGKCRPPPPPLPGEGCQSAFWESPNIPGGKIKVKRCHPKIAGV